MNPKYRVVLPNETYRGKSYSEWICDWINWFFSVDPDGTNNGPVVFLKQFPSLADNISEEGSATADEMLTNYKNRPNIMVGDESIEIFDDQAILCPLIMAYWAAAYGGPSDTEAFLRQKVRSDIDNGDDPPLQSQITINGRDIEVDPKVSMKSYRFETPVFPLMVPDVDYGKSYKDFVEYPVEAGNFQAVGCGYFFLIEGLKEGPYVIHSHAKGRTTENGDYYAELLYDINVRSANERGIPARSGVIPGRITSYVKNKLREKLAEGSLTQARFDELDSIFTKSRQTIKNQLRIQGGKP